MKMYQKYFIPVLSVITLSGCSVIPGDAYFNRGTPESLLDVSSEVITSPLNDQLSVEELTNIVERDQPTRAELYCSDASTHCAMAEEIFNVYNVDYDFIPSDKNEAVIYYERVIARDCEQRYIDNSINPYNLNHTTFGCSTAANMVQMVGDKRQFTSPALLDKMDGRSLETVMENYRNPPSSQTSNQTLDVSGISLD